MGAGEHQTLSSSILKGMIQNPSLKQVELRGCDLEGRFYNFMYVQNILPMDLRSFINFEDHVLYSHLYRMVVFSLLITSLDLFDQLVPVYGL